MQWLLPELPSTNAIFEASGHTEKRVTSSSSLSPSVKMSV